MIFTFDWIYWKEKWHGEKERMRRGEGKKAGARGRGVRNPSSICWFIPLKWLIFHHLVPAFLGLKPACGNLMNSATDPRFWLFFFTKMSLTLNFMFPQMFWNTLICTCICKFRQNIPRGNIPNMIFGKWCRCSRVICQKEL